MVGQEGRNWSTAEKYFSFLFVQGRNFHQKISLIYVGHFLNIFLLNMIGQYLLSALPKSSTTEPFSFCIISNKHHCTENISTWSVESCALSPMKIKCIFLWLFYFPIFHIQFVVISIFTEALTGCIYTINTNNGELPIRKVSPTNSEVKTICHSHHSSCINTRFLLLIPGV